MLWYTVTIVIDILSFLKGLILIYNYFRNFTARTLLKELQKAATFTNDKDASMVT